MNALQIPGYSIEREIGRGGMASVYLAVQRKFGRLVAIKILSTQISADVGSTQRFVREARILAQLTHPGIVQVHDAGVQDGRYYLVMEYLRGGDLNRRLERGMHMQAAVAVIKDIARALDFAHAKGFIHLDIKPENILFREDGSAVLSDFGIARLLKDAGEQQSQVLGTPPYMSPEQAAGRALDKRSDFYSLGIVLYQILAGDVPFKGSAETSVAMQHLQEPVPRLPGYLAHFQPVIDKLLAKRPDARYQSGSELISALDQLRVSGRIPNTVIKTQVVTTAELRAVSDMPLLSDPRALRAEPRPERRSASARRRSRYWMGALTLLVLLFGSGSGWLLISGNERMADWLSSLGLMESAEVEDAWRVAQSLRRDPNQSLSAVVAAYRRVISLDPGHTRAAEHLTQLVQRARQDVSDALAAGDWALAEQRVNDALLAFPADETLGQLFEQLTLRKRTETLVATNQALLSSRGLQDLASANAAILTYHEVLRLDPEHQVARDDLALLARQYERMAQSALDDGDITFAMGYLQVAALANPDSTGLPLLRERISQATQLQAEIDSLMLQAARHRRDGALLEPPGANAVELYKLVLATDPLNRVAEQSLAEVSELVLRQARNLLSANRLGEAQALAERAREIGLPNGLDAAVVTLVTSETQRVGRLAEHMQQARRLMEEGMISAPADNNAILHINAALALEPGYAEALALRESAARRLAVVAQDAWEFEMRVQARGLLSQALTLMPENSDWQRLQRQWAEVEP